jgi:hypothetical protein
VSAPAPQPPAPAGKGSRGRRWLTRALLLAAILLGAYLLRAPLLRGLASVLVAEDPAFPADHLLLLGGDGGCERAAGHLHSHPDAQVLLVRREPGRLESLGLVPSRLAVRRRELLARGVPPGAITVLPGQARTGWDVARRLREWLPGRPDACVLVFCHRFDSRRLGRIFGRVLGGEAPRVGFLGLRSRHYDEADWWRHKPGLLDFLDSSLRLGFTFFAGEGDEDPPDWDPDAYERSLR